MTNPNWEDVSVPRGAFIGWGDHTGQHVTGKVLDYSPAGGTNFAGDPCPQLSVELVEPAASFNKAGERTDFAAGELVVLNCGQVSLKRAVIAAQLSQGDLVKIVLAQFVKTANGTVKEFEIKVARGAARAAAAAQDFSAAAAAQPAAPAPATEAQPPF